MLHSHGVVVSVDSVGSAGTVSTISSDEAIKTKKSQGLLSIRLTDKVCTV